MEGPRIDVGDISPEPTQVSVQVVVRYPVSPSPLFSAGRSVYRPPFDQPHVTQSIFVTLDPPPIVFPLGMWRWEQSLAGWFGGID